MIGQGVKVQFVPACLQCMHDTPLDIRDKTVTCTIILVNWENRVFFAEYESGGTRQVEAFQFFGIGKSVKILGR